MTSRWQFRYVLAIVLASVVAYSVARHKRDFWDFEVYRTAGIRAVHAEQLYRADDGHYQFKYWPAFAFVASPFGLIPNEAGKMVWFGLAVACLVFVLQRSLDLLPDRRQSARILVGFTLLITTKFVVKELVNGQTNLLMLALALSAFAAGQRNRPWLAGLYIGLATIAKPYALILAPWVAVSFGASALVSVGLAVIAALVLPALEYGWHGNLLLLRDWYATVTSTTAPNLMFAENISYGTTWAKWIGIGTNASILTAISSVAILAVAVWIWWKRTPVRVPGYLELGVLLMMVPLISPQGWDYVLIIALPAYMCLLDRLGTLSTAWRLATLVGIFLTSFTVFDVVGRNLYIWMMAASVVSVGATMLIACLAHLRARAIA
jgi:hypothetical protein